MNFKESKAIYLQIADRICDEILLGQYREEERIPSVREYAAVVEVNANTVMRSFERLQTHNIIYNKRGIGYFVTDEAESEIRRMRYSQFVTEVLPTVFKEMDLLGIGINELTAIYNNHTEAEGG